MHPIAGHGDGSSCPQWNQKVEPTWSFRLKGFDFVVVISTTVQGQACDSLAPPGAAGFLSSMVGCAPCTGSFDFSLILLMIC
jgi:hypothetical protein